jgi:hypothetical protein
MSLPLFHLRSHSLEWSNISVGSNLLPTKIGAVVADIAEQIQHQLHAWQIRRSARIPEQAQQVVIAAVSAIVYDPHPGWRLPSGMGFWISMEDGLREVQQDAINKLPDLLDEIAMSSPDGKNIDTFTLLHRMSGVLDRICPFDKLR